jgi:hypothetical protein
MEGTQVYTIYEVEAFVHRSPDVVACLSYGVTTRGAERCRRDGKRPVESSDGSSAPVVGLSTRAPGARTIQRKPVPSCSQSLRRYAAKRHSCRGEDYAEQLGTV